MRALLRFVQTSSPNDKAGRRGMVALDWRGMQWCRGRDEQDGALNARKAGWPFGRRAIH